MNGRLAGKVAFVLGAAAPGNMGQAIARRFAGEGARVMAAGRHEEALSGLAAEISGGWSLCDITDEASLAAALAETRARFGRLDIAVNATGWALTKPFLKTTREELEKIAAVQFIGPLLFFRAVLPLLEQGGALIQISSATAVLATENHVAYGASKAAIDHAVRILADEAGPRGIRVNALAPGFTRSPMTEEYFRTPGVAEAFRAEVPLGRLGTVEDIAEAALFLAEEGSFVTGQVLQVNGGLTLRRNPRISEIRAAMAAAAP